MKSRIVTGQKVDPIKLQRAKELRSQMTSAEKILWKHLRKKQLSGFHFRRQQIIDGFIVDFYCHQAGLIIELDGEIHSSQKEYDTERDQVLSARGLEVLRIKNQEIKDNLFLVLKKIVDNYLLKKSHLSPSFPQGKEELYISPLRVGEGPGEG